MASYDLDLSKVLRSIRQRKATGGFVPSGFVNDVLEANIKTAASRAASEKSLALQEKSLEQSASEAEKNRQLSRELAAQNLAEAEKNREAQGKQNITSTLTQIPSTVLVGKMMYDKLWPKTPTTITPTTPDLSGATMGGAADISGYTSGTAPELATGTPALETPSLYQSPVWGGESATPAYLEQSAAPAYLEPSPLYESPTFGAGTANPELSAITGTGAVDETILSAGGADMAASGAGVGAGGEILSAGGADMAVEAGGATLGGAASAVMPYAWIPLAAKIGGMAIESIGGGYDKEKDSGTGAARFGETLQNVWEGPGPTSAETLLGKNYAGDATTTLNTVQDFLNPAGALVRKAGIGTWICTEISKRYGIDDEDNKMLSNLRRYSIKNHREWADKYLKEGYRLIDTMNKQDEINGKYLALKDSLVKAVCELVKNGELEAAYEKYKEITLSLCAEYGVEI